MLNDSKTQKNRKMSPIQQSKIATKFALECKHYIISKINLYKFPSLLSQNYAIFMKYMIKNAE